MIVNILKTSKGPIVIRILTPDDTQDAVPTACRHWLTKWPNQHIALCSCMCHAMAASGPEDALRSCIDLDRVCNALPDEPHPRA